MVLIKLAIAAMLMQASAVVQSDEPPRISVQEKYERVKPLITEAVICFARNIASFPLGKAKDLGDEIQAAAPACVGAINVLIEGYDVYFGKGAGDHYFNGPFLDMLPERVMDYLKEGHI